MMLNYVYSDLPNKSPPLDSFGQGGGAVIATKEVQFKIRFKKVWFYHPSDSKILYIILRCFVAYSKHKITYFLLQLPTSRFSAIMSPRYTQFYRFNKK